MPAKPLLHPAGTLVNSVKCNKPVNSASHYGQWSPFFLTCGHTNSVENPWISQSSLKRIKENSNFCDYMVFLQKLDSDYFNLISNFWLRVRIYWSLCDFPMVSDNESEFTDSKSSLIQGAEFPVRIFDHFANFQFYNILITLKIQKW